MLNNINRANFFLFCCLIANVATLPALTAHANPHTTDAPTLSNDDTTFVFADRCPNGEPYRISAYQIEIDGLSQSFYDFEGPAGKGTIRTNAQPKKMVTRVCRHLADIHDGSKFD